MGLIRMDMGLQFRGFRAAFVGISLGFRVSDEGYIVGVRV